MESGRVIFLNGPSSAGKSCIATCLKACLPERHFSLSFDAFGNMLHGPLRPDFTITEYRAMEPQIALAFHECIASTVRSGIHVIVDHVLKKPEWTMQCAAALRDLNAYFVGVFCSLQELERRERARGDRRIGGARSQLATVHSYEIYDLEVDTTSASPDACAQQILSLVSAATPPSAFRTMARDGLTLRCPAANPPGQTDSIAPAVRGRIPR